MRVLVCGGRNFSDRELLFSQLNLLHVKHGPFTKIIHGDQNGADKLAGQWARSFGIEEVACAAQGTTYHRAAYAARNTRMIQLHDPELVVAFPGGPGTRNMVLQSKMAGIRVIKSGDWPA